MHHRPHAYANAFQGLEYPTIRTRPPREEADEQFWLLSGEFGFRNSQDIAIGAGSKAFFRDGLLRAVMSAGKPGTVQSSGGVNPRSAVRLEHDVFHARLNFVHELTRVDSDSR
jgi:hypothetical protein